ncbi:hypothetical protein LRP49_07895 [Enterovibrio sp. ZSDZ35]|uniref:Uncharacterized protein n=1 Tax=Enterovibrio qingdaonensis TaxID=2899818 RepID=A0ABT5QKW7_9GAMM|nr:hypothetical protein [Enterovibrio sp. ZSDZ35]MDD1781125.1 hypothetical protein [Enterovibrio sp. ZSDZ35]
MKKILIGALIAFGLMGTAYAFDGHWGHGWDESSWSVFGCDHGSHHR